MLARLLASLANLFDLNMATLSGCSDIIVVKGPDGSLQSTPFHVRFGKCKILQSRESKVSISINDRLVSLTMYLNVAGEGYFVLPKKSPDTSSYSERGSPDRQTNENDATSYPSVQSAEPPCIASLLCQGFPNPPETKDRQEPSSHSWTLRPTSSQLSFLNLNPGHNSVEYSAVSALFGKQVIRGSIYLWDSSVRIVVSDIDGTITRSDMLGHLLPIIKKDWSHLGIAGLFSYLERNNYKLLYLSSRPIGQAEATRHYLWDVRQGVNREGLPNGPLILNPNRLFSSFHKEVVERSPHLFKIAMLRDLRKMFPPEKNPYHAAFGNRHTDYLAYTAVQIPPSRIYMVNSQGMLRNYDLGNQLRSYSSLYNIADQIFPKIPEPLLTKDPCSSEKNPGIDTTSSSVFTF